MERAGQRWERGVPRPSYQSAGGSRPTPQLQVKILCGKSCSMRGEYHVRMWFTFVCSMGVYGCDGTGSN